MSIYRINDSSVVISESGYPFSVRLNVGIQSISITHQEAAQLAACLAHALNEIRRKLPDCNKDDLDI